MLTGCSKETALETIQEQTAPQSSLFNTYEPKQTGSLRYRLQIPGRESKIPQCKTGDPVTVVTEYTGPLGIEGIKVDSIDSFDGTLTINSELDTGLNYIDGIHVLSETDTLYSVPSELDTLFAAFTDTTVPLQIEILNGTSTDVYATAMCIQESSLPITTPISELGEGVLEIYNQPFQVAYFRIIEGSNDFIEDVDIAIDGEYKYTVPVNGDGVYRFLIPRDFELLELSPQYLGRVVGYRSFESYNDDGLITYDDVIDFFVE